MLNTDAQGAFVNILGNIAFGRLPRDVLSFFSSWSFTILVVKETSAERYINAPSMLSRSAFSGVALLDSSECLQELKPLQLAFGTPPGGSEIMSSVDAFMRDATPANWISVKSDFKGFYYGTDLYRIAQS